MGEAAQGHHLCSLPCLDTYKIHYCKKKKKKKWYPKETFFILKTY
jgi:hypothetical protein